MPRSKIIALVTSLTVAVLTSVFDVYSDTSDTCLECRATLEKRWIFGVPIQWTAHNSYSKTFIERAPVHNHQWRYCGSRHRYSLVSVTHSCGRMHPIWMLPVDVQAEYARVASASELRDTLRALDEATDLEAMKVVNRIHEVVLGSH